MITAVDTNVFLDILIGSAPHHESSQFALARAVDAGSVVASEAVYAELAAQFPAHRNLDEFLEGRVVGLSASTAAALYRAGQAWVSYAARRPRTLTCPQCGASNDVRCASCGSVIQMRQHLVTDFLIGAHAVVHADALLTRDRGFYTTYFPELPLLGGA